MDEDDIKGRRSLMQRGAAAGAALGLGALLGGRDARAATSEITAGDIAILKFLAVAELVETDLWEQYSELAQNNPTYRTFLTDTDPSIVQYIVDTERDERSHAIFINAFLASIGVEPVNLNQFTTLPSPNVTGLKQVGRLTNLTNLTIDTSWYNRYRQAANPDFGNKPAQLLNIQSSPAIPTSNNLKSGDVRATADAALFHFCMIEQGGASLYTQFLPKISSATVVQILAGIGPVEAIHFGVFQTSLEGLAPFASPETAVLFPDLRNNKLLSNSVMPAPCPFVNSSLPTNSVIRPSSTADAGAVAAATGLVNSGLFSGQPANFFSAVVALAEAADAAVRAF